MKIRNKFTLTTTLTTVIIMTIFTIYLILSQYNDQMKYFYDKIEKTNDFAKIIFFSPLWNVDLKSIKQAADALLLDEYIEGVEIMDDEKIVFKSHKTGNGIKIVKNIPMISDDRVIGNIRITYTKRIIDQMTANMIRHFILLSIVLIISLYFTIQLSAFSVTRPLENIIINLKRIASGNYDDRIETRAEGELKILQDTINIMCLELKTRESTIKKVTVESMSNDTKYQLEKQKYEMEKMQREVADKLKSELENSNLQLKKAFEEQRKIQNQLILSEKMAVLGGLVAGVAHEINTPLGIGVTSASFLDEKTNELKKQLENNQLKKSTLEEYIRIADECSKMLLLNLSKASELVKSFKQVSVDQTSEDKRLFNIKEYLNEILQSLHPKLKKTKHKVIVDCNDKISIDSYPGAFSQIITNFIMNSLIHGFENIEEGIIEILVEKTENSLKLSYKDNGKGMSEESLKKIFEPFYTTKRNSGGTGLGTYIIYNIVTQRLKGTISIKSEPNNGVFFDIEFPV